MDPTKTPIGLAEGRNELVDENNNLKSLLESVGFKVSVKVEDSSIFSFKETPHDLTFISRIDSFWR